MCLTDSILISPSLDFEQPDTSLDFVVSYPRVSSTVLCGARLGLSAFVIFRNVWFALEMDGVTRDPNDATRASLGVPLSFS